MKMLLILFLLTICFQVSVNQDPDPKYADVVFLVDSSDELGIKFFPQMKNFITRMINTLPIETNKYRVALAQYSDKLHSEFQLSNFKSKNPMLNHLKKNFGFLGGSLRIGNALREVHRTYFSGPTNGRDKKQFPPILVVLASGESQDDVKVAAQALQKDGVRIISVGMQKASEEDLRAMATSSFRYKLRTVRDLSTFSQNMTDIIKEATQYQDRVTDDVLVEACQGPSVADLVFLLDVAINGSQENFDSLKGFLEESVSALDIKENCMRISLVAYTSEAKVLTSLNKGVNKSELLQYIQNLSPQAGEAYMGAAIRKIRKEVFSVQNGSRKNQGVPQIAVLLAHRPSEDNVTKAAVNLRRQGVTVFTMGIEGANYSQLELIASHPAEQYLSKLKSFSHLAAHNQTFLKKLRNQITHTVSVFSERTLTLKSGCEDTEEADIYLLIDGSASTQATDFQETKTFLSEVVRMFNIGPQKVRVGAVQYAENWDLEFEIDKYSNKQDLGKAIENIRQMDGSRNTGAALNYTLGLLQKAKKQRANRVPSHLLVLTSGTSQDSVVEPALRLREEFIHVHAIGVKGANHTQLQEMAGEEQRVYYVHDFDALKDIRNQVVQEICAEEACREMKADIMFLVDSSGSIGLENFSKMKAFMKNLVSKSQIGPDKVQIGVVQFSDINKEEFPLNRYMSQSEISNAIDAMGHIGETTMTGSALTFVSQNFSPAKGARPSVKRFLILITDGEAHDAVTDPAAALRQEGIIIYSVGVFGSNVTQLEEISGRRELVFYVENFDILQHIEDDLVFGICSPREECKRIEVLDVVFVIDSSGSIDSNEYNIMKDFMIDLVKKSDIGKNQVRFGALKYADYPQVLFYLDKFDTKREVISALQKDQPMGGNTYTAEALRFSEHMFTEAHGGRLHKGVPQVLIVITDGESHDSDKLNTTAKALRDQGILVLAVGIDGANTEELLAMAGSSDKYFFVKTFGGLKGIFSDVSASVCSSSKVDCEIEKVDLVFLMDGSNSIYPDDFRKMKEFLASVVRDFDVSLNRVHIGAAQFSDSYQPEFPLGTFTGKEEISRQIENIQQLFGYTHIGAALRKVARYFLPDTGSRIHAGTPQVLLVLTDGKSQDEVAQAAEELRNRGIDIYSVGIGNVDDQQLVQITGTADKKLTVHNFDELKQIKKRIVRNICTTGGESNCFVDVVVGFDISTQRNGQSLFEGQSWMETYLPNVLHAISSLNGVSCEVGTETQVSVAFQVTHAMEKYTPKFEIYSDTIMNSLKDVTVKGPSLLNANLLSSLWDTFQNKSAARGKVVLLFSDGLDEDIEKLEQKSDELRKEGLNALLTVALDGATDSSDLTELPYIEFGKGFEYRTQLTLGMRDLGSRLSKYLVNVAERTCCCLFCKCMGEDGTMGDPGLPGKRGIPGFKGSEGYLGEEGIAGERGAIGPMGEQGTKGCSGTKGPKGLRGLNGQEGENGEIGIDGLNGEQGDSGLPGVKGEKGEAGSQGSPGERGILGERGSPGLRGDPGDPGFDNSIEGSKGSKGERGRQGRRGSQGIPGPPGSGRKTGARGRRGLPGPQGEVGIQGPDGLEGSPGFPGSQGSRGETGVKGEKGSPGSKGPQGPQGPGGRAGSPGRLGSQGHKGDPGDLGEKGALGLPGPRGLPGNDGNHGYGVTGSKGAKGQEGFPGESGPKGEIGDPGDPGETGPKGERGKMVSGGLPGELGSPGEAGPPGRRGVKGSKGLTSFSVCELLQYVRDHSPCRNGMPECPVHPTELVFALDQSQDVTQEDFERMKQMMSSVVQAVRVRDHSCPVGARVAILSYSSHTRHLVRFSDAYAKNRLLQEIEAIPYEKSSENREMGKAMRFISRNVFKRTLPGPRTRRIATFFSSGQSTDAQAITTATMEFSALDIVPVVIAFSNVPSVKRAFAIDDTGTFQVIVLPSGTEHSPALERLQLCTFCHDVCKPDASCEEETRPAPPPSYVDVAFLLDSSRHMGGPEFEDVRGFLGALLDHFEISSDPETSTTGDRVALLSHAPPDFRPHMHKSPVRTEFNLTTYSSKHRMKRHLENSVQKLHGDAFLGHALQWTLDNIFSGTPNLRRHRVIFVISAGETSPLDRETLKKESLRAKCQGYALFVFSLGPTWNDKELEDLASQPLDHHLVQLGRIHKPDHRYGVKFVKSFVNSIRRAINKYPPINFRTKCSRLSSTEARPSPQLLRSFVPGPQKAILKEALQKAKFFQDKKFPSRAARGSSEKAVRYLTKSLSHTITSGEKVIKAAAK